MDSKHYKGPINTTAISYLAITDPFVSDEFRVIFQWLCFTVVCQSIAIFGTVTNIINSVCFVKQGFKDPINVTLFGLAMSDLGCLVTLIWLNICFTPSFQQADLPFDPTGILYLTAGWPHVIFTRVTSWITAFITLERCLCIAVPLKVKRLFSSKRVTIIIVLTFMLLICSVSPMYCVNSFATIIQRHTNRTILILIHTANRESVEKVSVIINNVIIPFGSFATVIVSTVALVIQLKKKAKWRLSSASVQSNAFLSRDQKISKMVMLISTVFIICFTPSCFSFLAMALEPRLTIDGAFKNTFIVIFGVGFVLESANSSVNIFIYYNMSSKYRATFRQIFSFRNQVETKGN